MTRLRKLPMHFLRLKFILIDGLKHIGQFILIGELIHVGEFIHVGGLIVGRVPILVKP